MPGSLSHLRRNRALMSVSVWKMVVGMARSVTGAPTGFRDTTNEQLRPGPLTVSSPRNSAILFPTVIAHAF